jgi:hypothetical protein
MAFLKDNPDLQSELETRLREAMGLRPVGPVAVPRAAGE